MIEASCHCGAVRLEIDSPPDEVTDCHCSICRRYGALWACLERIPPGEKADVDWITGGQSWAGSVSLEACLSPAGPVCTRGDLGPL